MATAESLVQDLQSYTDAGTTLPSDQALECVNQAIRKMQRKHDFRLMQQSTQLIIPGGATNWVPLPYDFLHEVYVYLIDPSTTNPAQGLIPVRRLLKPQWFQRVSPWANADPQFPNVAFPAAQNAINLELNYYIWSGRLVIVDAPSMPLTIDLDYMRIVPDLLLGLTPPDQNDLTTFYPDVIRWGGLAEAYAFLHETEMAAGSAQTFESKLKDAIDADNAIQFAGPPAKRGT